jgi:hypothetical protein
LPTGTGNPLQEEWWSWNKQWLDQETEQHPNKNKQPFSSSQIQTSVEQQYNMKETQNGFQMKFVINTCLQANLK